MQQRQMFASHDKAGQATAPMGVALVRQADVESTHMQRVIKDGREVEVTYMAEGCTVISKINN
jgi:hypothetical protein